MTRFGINGRRAAGSLVRQLNKVTRKLVRLDQAKIVAALESFGSFKADTLLVHSSLSACGYVEDGPAAVVQALRKWIREPALLAMPTHTWSYPNASAAAPIYDLKETRSLVGAITDFFWRQQGVVRSLHPSHSLACQGPDAELFCRDHELRETPCGAGTPYEQMVKGKTSVLMFGATLDSYTLFHTAEDAARVPYLYMPDMMTLKTRKADGQVVDVKSWRQNMGVARRFEETVDWLASEKLVERRKLGRGELLFIPRADLVHEKVLSEMKRDPLFLVAEDARDAASRI